MLLLFTSFGFVRANENRVNANLGITAALIIMMCAQWNDIPFLRSSDSLNMGAYRSAVHASDCGAIFWPAHSALVNPMLLPAAAFTYVVACAIDIMNLNAHNRFPFCLSACGLFANR